MDFKLIPNTSLRMIPESPLVIQLSKLYKREETDYFKFIFRVLKEHTALCCFLNVKNCYVYTVIKKYH